MGITGLLPALKSIMHKAHLNEYSGLRAGIDAYSWLHRGAHCCLMELALGQDTDKFVNFCMDRIQLLLRHGITPIVVFDGARPPIKKEKNLERRRVREEAREKGLALYQEGKNAESYNAFKKAVAVTDHMARKFIKALKAVGVRFVVAPYEADAQLAYLSMRGIVDIVITEDGDTIPFGCRKVLFKLDKDGNVDEFDVRNLGANEQLSFKGWNNNMFLDMCLLAGCDYLISVPGLGLKTAYKLVKQHRHCKKVLRELRYLTDAQLPDDFEELFARARLAFRHHLVYDIEKQCMVPLNPFKEEHQGMDLSFIGQQLPPDVAQGVAEGRLHPTTHRPYSSDHDEAPGVEEDEEDLNDESARGDAPAAPQRPATSAAGGTSDNATAPGHEVTRPAWSALGDSPPDYAASHQRLGTAPLYTREECKEDAKRAAHLQSMRSVDVAVRCAPSSSGRVATADPTSAPLPLEPVIASVTRPPTARVANQQAPPVPEEAAQSSSVTAGSTRTVPAFRARSFTFPGLRPQADAAQSSTGARPASADGPREKERGHEEYRYEDDEEDEYGQRVIPRRSAYFLPTGQDEATGDKDKVQNAKEAHAALQRLEELERTRREESALQRQLNKRKVPVVTFKTPVSGIDFQSPMVSDEVETLYRRQKRIRDAIAPPIDSQTTLKGPASPKHSRQEVPRPLQPQGNRSPTGSQSSVSLFAGGLAALQQPEPMDDEASAAPISYIEYVPKFAASPAVPEARYEAHHTRQQPQWQEEPGVGFFSRVKEEVPRLARSPPRASQPPGLTIFRPPSPAPIDKSSQPPRGRDRSSQPHSSSSKRHHHEVRVHQPGVGIFAPTVPSRSLDPPPPQPRRDRREQGPNCKGVGFFAEAMRPAASLTSPSRANWVPPLSPNIAGFTSSDRPGGHQRVTG